MRYEVSLLIESKVLTMIPPGLVLPEASDIICTCLFWPDWALLLWVFTFPLLHLFFLLPEICFSRSSHAHSLALFGALVKGYHLRAAFPGFPSNPEPLRLSNSSPLLCLPHITSVMNYIYICIILHHCVIGHPTRRAGFYLPGSQLYQ